MPQPPKQTSQTTDSAINKTTSKRPDLGLQDCLMNMGSTEIREYIWSTNLFRGPKSKS